MKHLTVLAALSAALMTSACVTVIDAGDRNELVWHGNNAQPFDSARAECGASAGRGSAAFRDCMAGKGWTRS